MEDIFGGLESAVNNPYTYMRIGKITKIYDIGDESKYYLTCAIEWVDRAGQIGDDSATISKSKLSYPHVSSGWGFTYRPSVGDLVLCGFRVGGYPVILGYQSINMYEKVSKDRKMPAFSFRPLFEGEYSWKSKAGCEVYLDKMGSMHLIVRDTAKTIPDPRGISGSTNLVKDEPLFEITLGKVFNNLGKTYKDLFQTSNEQKSIAGNPIRMQIEDYKTGNKITIDSAGNLEIINTGTINISSKGNVTLAMDAGSKLSVTGDNAEIVGTQSLALKSDISNLKTAFDSHTHVYAPGLGAPASSEKPATPAPTPVGTTKLKAS